MTAVLTANLVTGINITNAGTGFTSAPTLTFGTGTVLVAGTNPSAPALAKAFADFGNTETNASLAGTPIQGVPEPGSFTLLITGALGLLTRRRHSR